MAELFANLARTTLTANIDSVVVTFSVASVALFPATGNFRIVIDTEIMLVTSVNVGANQLTVTRAAEGPYAASTHLAGASVVHILTKASIATLGGAGALAYPAVITGTTSAGGTTAVIGLGLNGTATSTGTGSVAILNISGTATGSTVRGVAIGVGGGSSLVASANSSIVAGFATTDASYDASSFTGVIGVGAQLGVTWLTPGAKQVSVAILKASGASCNIGAFFDNVGDGGTGLTGIPASGNYTIYSLNTNPSNISGAFYPATPALAVQTACAFWAGTGAPSNTNGANGDIYANGAGGAGTTIYQKRAGAWVGIV